MPGVLTDLITSLAASSGLVRSFADSDEFWFRANDRFDICVSWVHYEHSVQLAAFLHAPEGESIWHATEFEPDPTDPGWRATASRQGDWMHLLVQHQPSSMVAALSRASAQSLDAVSFPAFVQAFIDRLETLDPRFCGALDNDGVQPPQGLDHGKLHR